MSPFHGGYIRGAAVGYVLPPLAAKLRCARTAGTFFIMACHRGGSVYGAAAPSPPSEEGGGFLSRRGKKTEGEIHRVCAKVVGIDEN